PELEGDVPRGGDIERAGEDAVEVLEVVVTERGAVAARNDDAGEIAVDIRRHVDHRPIEDVDAGDVARHGACRRIQIQRRKVLLEDQWLIRSCIESAAAIGGEEARADRRRVDRLLRYYARHRRGIGSDDRGRAG